MKRLSALFMILILGACQAFAQVPNGEFENWAVYDVNGIVMMPQSWKTTDSLSFYNPTAQHSADQEVVDVQSGFTSLRLTSWGYYINPGPILFIPGLPGCATNGDVEANIASLTINPVKGTPDNIAHAQLNGYYKYTPILTDTGSVEVVLYKRNTSTGNRDTIASGIYKTISQNAYTHFSLNLTRYLPGDPDSMLIWLQSSPRAPISFGVGPGHTGSLLLIDSLDFSGTIGINEIERAIRSVSLFPLPASNDLNLIIDLNKQVRLVSEVYDVNGNLIFSKPLNSLDQSLDVSGLSNGQYVLGLSDEHHNRLYISGFTVQR